MLTHNIIIGLLSFSLNLQSSTIMLVVLIFAAHALKVKDDETITELIHYTTIGIICRLGIIAGFVIGSLIGVFSVATLTKVNNASISVVDLTPKSDE